jgi:imidazolonepropionase-like amidohydrolase
MRGFTTVRNLGGPAFGLKRAIDEGIVSGPRIYPSGAMITSPVVTGTSDSVRAAARPRRPAISRGADWRCHGRRQPG